MPSPVDVDAVCEKLRAQYPEYSRLKVNKLRAVVRFGPGWLTKRWFGWAHGVL